MICAVYKSPRKDETYLYVPNRDDFSAVPEALMNTFGKPQFVMLLPLSKRNHLARLSSDELKAALDEQGFYLQVPPPKEDLLKQHRADRGLTDADHD